VRAPPQRSEPGGAAQPDGDGGLRVAAGVIQYLRAEFAVSRYADLRDAGMQTADSLELYQLAPTASTVKENIYYLNNYANAVMGTLVGACESHGVRLPYLKTN
jgi:hypothetical protein